MAGLLQADGSMKIVDIVFKGIGLSVTGRYVYPEESVRNYPDGSGYPGAGGAFEVLCVEKIFRGVYHDVTDIYDSLELTEEISKLCLEKIESE